MIYRRIQRVARIRDSYNPATWMLEVTSSAQEMISGVDFAELYKNSELYSLQWNLFSGFLMPRPRTLYGLLMSQFGDVRDELEITKQPVQELLTSYIGFRHDFIGVVALMVAGFGVLFAFVFAFAVKTLNFQKR